MICFPILSHSFVTMSKSSKSVLEAGGGRKRGQEEEQDIFCEKCNFVFQGEFEFKNHLCQQNTSSVMDISNKKVAISLDNRKGRQSNDKVITLIVV
jgi:hypothetical protein